MVNDVVINLKNRQETSAHERWDFGRLREHGVREREKTFKPRMQTVVGKVIACA